jgi:cell division septation protein DedD
MDEWRPHEIPPPEDDEFEELERRRYRREPERRWVGPLLIGVGALLVGLMSFSVCGGSDSLEGQRLAGPSDAEVREALESGLAAQPAYPTEAEAAASGDAPGAAPEPRLPDVAAPGPDYRSAASPATPQPAAAPAPAPGATPQVAAAPPPAAVRAGTGSFSIQLASVRDAAATTGLWEQVLAEHPDLFAGVSPHVQQADLGERGVYHRLRVGPFASRETAQRTCDVYQARGGSCLVVTN